MATEENIIQIEEKQKKVVSTNKLIIFFVIGSMCVSLTGSYFMSHFLIQKKIAEYDNKKDREVKTEIVRLHEDDIVSVVEKVSPSVVSIVVSKEMPRYQKLYNSPLDLFFGQPNTSPQGQNQNKNEKQKIGGGTGFFVSKDGLVVTNRHVVVDTDAEYTVVTSDGKEHSATVLARDTLLDFAVLKIEGNDFVSVELADSDAIKIGQTVVAIGNSLGEFSNSVSRGIISGVQRNIIAGGGSGGTEELADIIQTDAAINFGNSGGPLLDVEGKVIGINTAIAQGAENVGFALPINSVKRLVDDVQRTGSISRPFIGVRYVELTQDIRDALNVKYESGVLVVRGEKITDFAVSPGSPADKAGIMENDIILEIDGKKVDKKNSLAVLVAQYSVGDKITVKIWHKGEEKSLQVMLEDKKNTQ